jgi:hypothetical protein
VPESIRITVPGIEQVIANLSRFPREIARTLSLAGHEAGNEILDTQGVRQYPPATAANQPPTPYYIRGRGMQYKRGNDGRSERYGTQFYVKREGAYTTIGNRASYAKYLAGREQARRMAAIGWRKLVDVAKEKRARIEQIYQGWVTRLIGELKL